MQGSSVPLVLHEEFMEVLNMLASLESRVEVLTKHEEELRGGHLQDNTVGSSHGHS